MIPLFFLAAALTDISGDAARGAACQKLIQADPKAAVEQATAWADRDKSIPARQCLGLAYVGVERWAPAETALAQAAAQADADRDARGPRLWSQAANAALAGDAPGKAREDLDHALTAAGLPAALNGEAWIDRARADVALNELPQARVDMDKGLALVPQDPAYQAGQSLGRVLGAGLRWVRRIAGE